MYYYRLISSMSKTPPYVALLDTYTGAAASYSLRKMRSAYTGYAIRVRRSSDDTTLDVGFKSDGSLDTTSLLSFVGSNNGFVSIWYDQSTSGKNATQPTLVNQPQIVISGTLQTLNGKPSLYFDGASRYLDCGYLNGGTKPANFSTWISGSFTDKTATRSIIASGDSGGNGTAAYNLIGIYSAASYYMFGGVGNGTQYRYWITATSPVTSQQYLFEQHYKSNTSPYLGVFYWNNVNKAVDDWLQGTSQSSGGTEYKTSIGRSGEDNGSYHKGYVQEVITYFSDQTTNRLGINTNINSFYSIY